MTVAEHQECLAFWFTRQHAVTHALTEVIASHTVLLIIVLRLTGGAGPGLTTFVGESEGPGSL